MKSRHKIGRLGEDSVCEYLLVAGHTILERNWRCGHLEIDIISLAENGIHFVEVKSRVAPVQAEPEEGVTAVKRKRVSDASKAYLAKNGWRLPENVETWLDIAAVTFDGGRSEIEYFPGAYVPIYI